MYLIENLLDLVGKIVMLKTRFVFVISLFFALTSAVSYAEETSSISAVSGIASTNYVDNQVSGKLDNSFEDKDKILVTNQEGAVETASKSDVFNYVPVGTDGTGGTAKMWIE